MREGPLAALFRRTDDDSAQKPAADKPGDQAPHKHADGPLTGQTPPPPEAPEQQSFEQSQQPASNEPAFVQPEPPRESAAPQPATAAGSVPLQDQVSPKERLKKVFAMDMPDNILEPSADEPPAPRYGREMPNAHAPNRQSAVSAVVTPVLRVVGVGGAGVNAVDRMIEAGVTGVEFVAINTDMQSLQGSSADVKLHIGGALTRGLGAGADPEMGARAAIGDYDAIKRVLKGSDMIFITAGAGGGTGTGAAPIVARIAREVEALTVGIVTTPFGFEGSRRKAQAQIGVDALSDEVDTLIV
ncbi:MAG TPA: cell division protein FtsZ, partial [Solirubrobacterales bacterium]|nr:cell division protein FtsZ [Solirubrobacterales bacterium]